MDHRRCPWRGRSTPWADKRLILADGLAAGDDDMALRAWPIAVCVFHMDWRKSEVERLAMTRWRFVLSGGGGAERYSNGCSPIRRGWRARSEGGFAL